MDYVSLTQEDQAMKDLVAKYGDKQWTLIAARLRSDYGIKRRTPKQCRERWCNYLKPSIVNEDWTESDEQMLFELHKVHGNTWSEIARCLAGRTDNCVKNHFYSTVRRNLRAYNQFHSPALAGDIKTLLQDPQVASILLRPNYKAPKRVKPQFVEIRKSARTRKSINYEITTSSDEEEEEPIEHVAPIKRAKTQPDLRPKLKPTPIICPSPIKVGEMWPGELSASHCLYSLSPLMQTPARPQYFVFPEVLEERTPRYCSWGLDFWSPRHWSPREVS